MNSIDATQYNILLDKWIQITYNVLQICNLCGSCKLRLRLCCNVVNKVVKGIKDCLTVPL